jgi:dipeptidyl aminopeptidase/acylaminoacyl peptidase
MRRFMLAALYGCLLSLCTGSALAQSRGPDDRPITDPHGVASTGNPRAHAIPVDDLYYTRSISDAAWSPDGKQLVFTTNLTGRENLWKVDAAGSWPVQLSQSNERQMHAVWSPDGKWIAYQQDYGGNELWDIFAVSSDGAQTINLTNTPEVREESPLWSPDGSTIALNIKPRAARSYDLALLDFKTRKVRYLTHEPSADRSWSVVAWSPDGRTLYANRYDIGFTDTDIYAVNVATGKATNLTPHSGQQVVQASSLSPDGRTLLITSNEKGGFFNVALLDIASGKRTWVTDTRWEAQSADYAPDGRSFTYLLNADGEVDAYIVDAATLHARKIPVGPGVNAFPGVPNSYAPAGGRLLLQHENSVTPGDYWIYDIRAASVRRLSNSAVASLASAPMPDSQVVHYRTFDGKTISALMWVPFNLRRDGANPALVLPHGGPTGQTEDRWSPRIAALVSHGYICIAPNVRGSTGYGMAFQLANHQDLGGGDLKDEVYAAKFLEATGYVDPKRIGITGGSYGGFMTLMAIGRTPQVWAAGVELFGIINWMTMLEHEDPQLQQYEKSLLGDPVKDRSVYLAASPLTYLHDARAPLLVLQGDNDPRVPKEEAQQVVAALTRDGKTVAAHYYPDEGHGFAKREDQIDAMRRTLEWFDRYLKGEGAKGATAGGGR